LSATFPSFKLARELDRTGLPGPMLAIYGANAALEATAGIDLQNTTQVVLGRLSSILKAVQLPNSSEKY
jgi:hypothetical protein